MGPFGVQVHRPRLDEVTEYSRFVLFSSRSCDWFFTQGARDSRCAHADFPQVIAMCHPVGQFHSSGAGSPMSERPFELANWWWIILRLMAPTGRHQRKMTSDTVQVRGARRTSGWVRSRLNKVRNGNQCPHSMSSIPDHSSRVGTCRSDDKPEAPSGPPAPRVSNSRRRVRSPEPANRRSVATRRGCRGR